MTQNITVKYGEYRNQPIINQSFELVKGYATGKRGGFITVKNDGKFPQVQIANVKIKVNNINDITWGTEKPIMADSNVELAPEVTETDDQAMDRIKTRFNILDDMAKATIAGDVRAMIVSGPPGVGKSYGVEQQMEKASLFDALTNSRTRYEVVKGAMTALGLYAVLYKYSDAKNVLVFDDCDSVFQDDLALNILKAALDSGKSRRICWNSDSSLLNREGIPNSFEFKGSAIFITNLKFENIKSKKLQDHLEALQSRCHFLDLTIDNERDKMLRIKQVDRDVEGGLFREYKFENNEGQQIFDFMEENASKLREISMRMALKIADLFKVTGVNNWKVLAESTCMRVR
jgi:predicted AAA+ superfamily ATPase|tara:strand:+ start:1033 stop:2070 length:1038 start_codon:yes stop_codon:yes gene_type:complete